MSDPMSAAEVAALGDQMLVAAGAEARLTEAVAEIDAQRKADQEAYRLATIDTPGGPLVPGHWYDLTIHYAFNRWKTERWVVAQYGNRSRAGVLSFTRWGASLRPRMAHCTAAEVEAVREIEAPPTVLAAIAEAEAADIAYRERMAAHRALIAEDDAAEAGT